MNPPGVLRWSVLHFDLDPTVGHEQGGAQRTLVVSYEEYHRSDMVTICPITAARSEPTYPNEVAIPKGEAGQTRDGVILCHQVRTVSTLRLSSLRGSSGQMDVVTDPHIRRAVRVALIQLLGLNIPLEEDGAVG